MTRTPLTRFQIIAEASAAAYRGATSEVQSKLRRVIEVWRQRQIFEVPIQDAVEARITGKPGRSPLRQLLGITDSSTDIDKTRSSGRKPLLGGSAHANGPAAPLELQPLIPLHTAVSKAATSLAAVNQTALAKDYTTLLDPSSSAEPAPSPPVHAARLSALLKSLAHAEGAASASVAARKDLLAALDGLMATQRTALAADEDAARQAQARRDAAEGKRREVEDAIMRGLATERPDDDDDAFEPTDAMAVDAWPPPHGRGAPADRPASGAGVNGRRGGSPSAEPERPQVEALTPPPTGGDEDGLAPLEEAEPMMAGALPSTQEDESQEDSAFGVAMAQAAAAGRGPPVDPEDGGSPYKRRRVEGPGEYGGFVDGDTMASLDDDVSELLRTEGGGG